MIQDQAVHQDIAAYCKEIRKRFLLRDQMFKKIEDIYFLRWDDEAALKKVPNVRVTKSPDARNAVIGARRLLTTTEPQITVPSTKNDPSARGIADRIEAGLDGMQRQMGRALGRPLHYDVVHSHLLFDESHIVLSSTADLVEAAQKAVDALPDGKRSFKAEAILAKAERMKEQTPYIPEVRNPRTGYPIWDGALGIQTGYYSISMRTFESLVDEFGEDALAAIRSAGKEYPECRYQYVEVHDFVDYTWRDVWFAKSPRSVLVEEHGLPFLPSICTIGEGSRLFDAEHERREPFLYTEVESGFWSRQSLAYTVLYTLMVTYGFSPLFKFKASDNNQLPPELKQMGLFQYLHLPAGSDWDVVNNKGILDAAWMQAMQIAERKVEENTIYKATLGGFLGGGTAYSTQSFLATLGRLPIETIRRMAGWAMGETFQKALLWLKHDGRDYSVKNTSAKIKGEAIEILAKEIPNNLEVQTTLDVGLPQDKQAQATVASMLWGKLSAKFLTEEIVQVPGYEQEQEQLMTEQAIGELFKNWLGRMTQVYAQAKQMTGAPMDGAAGMPPGTVPPEVAANVPPQVIAGGMQGPQEVMPPGTMPEL